MKAFILIILSATALAIAGCGGGGHHDNATTLYGNVDLVGGTHHPRSLLPRSTPMMTG